MSVSVPPAAGPGRPAAGRGLRAALAIDERAGFIAAAQTGAGRMLLLLAAMAAVIPHFGIWTGSLAVAAAIPSNAGPTVPVLAATAGLALPATIGSAVLRHRLIDHDQTGRVDQRLGDSQPPPHPTRVFR